MRTLDALSRAIMRVVEEEDEFDRTEHPVYEDPEFSGLRKALDRLREQWAKHPEMFGREETVAVPLSVARSILARLDLEAATTDGDFPCRALRSALRAALGNLAIHVPGGSPDPEPF